ncbi:MAG: hypothetical protein OEV91_08145 [Desulfobulbaceae bacterium]|nr:hypothetical protein [Desulfobulbaceae bacterium]HIJ91738.1 hypothetical protein [Deltaproteobacteria bacterium]
MSKKVCFMLAHLDYTLDGLRSCLGLAVENMYSFAVVMKNQLPPLDDYNKENIDWIRDMEGDVFSTVPANCENEGLGSLTIEELGQKLREMDVIVPYGIMAE